MRGTQVCANKRSKNNNGDIRRSFEDYKANWRQSGQPLALSHRLFLQYFCVDDASTVREILCFKNHFNLAVDDSIYSSYLWCPVSSTPRFARKKARDTNSVEKASASRFFCDS